MSDFKVEVCQANIEPHPNADAIELCKVGDYITIVQKGLYKTGDLVCYIPEASLLPIPMVNQMGLAGKLSGSNKNRVKAIRLRGIFSQGLIYPAKEGWVEGQDVAAELGITKYEPPVPQSLVGNVNSTGHKLGGPLAFNFDVENAKKYHRTFVEGEEVVFTEKIHGCLQKNTPIQLADGSKKTIGEIVDNKLEVEVLGLNENNQIVPSKVINWFNNGKTKEWFKVDFTRKFMQRGSAHGSIICTAKHRFFDAKNNSYKTCEELKPGDKLINNEKNKFQSFYVEQEVLSVTPYNPKGINHTKYDIETETHNYFANNILVHNSCFLVCLVPPALREPDMVDGKLIVISKGLAKSGLYLKDEPNNVNNAYLRMARQYKLSEKLDEFYGGSVVGPVWLLGEIYGVQDLKYGLGQSEIDARFFGLKGEQFGWLSWEPFEMVMKELGLKTVPVLYKGPYSKELMLQYTTGIEKVSGKESHLREGIVIYPKEERTDPKL
jgi:hypothetical protein